MTEEVRKFIRHYEADVYKAMRNPGVKIVCHQRYTFREWILRLLRKRFTPVYPRPTVTWYGAPWGFVIFPTSE